MPEGNRQRVFIKRICPAAGLPLALRAGSCGALRPSDGAKFFNVVLPRVRLAASARYTQRSTDHHSSGIASERSRRFTYHRDLLAIPRALALRRHPFADFRLVAGEPGKLLHHALIDRALERDDQVGKILHRLPSPADELRLVAAAGALHIDLGVVAGETNRVPFLPLAAIAALPGSPRHG